MKLNYYEIFDNFSSLKTKDERKAYLKKCENITLLKMMSACFNPRIKFFITHVPGKWKPNETIRPGMGDYTMEQVINKIYLFEVGNPRTPNLTYAKREQLLLQFLDGMEPREGKIFLDILFKTMDVKFLTASLVREVWPGLLPVSLDAPKKE